MAAVPDPASTEDKPGLGRSRLLRVAVPAIMLGLTLLVWEIYVRVNAVPPYILPAPSLVAQTLVKDWGTLYPALLVTLRITFSALILALVGGTLLAVLLVQSKWVELALYPYAVILQVTPIVAIAPLILVYVSSTQAAIMICAFLVAFFPILSNMVQGLKSVDHNLLNLYDLYGASRWQQLRMLKLPAALPYFMTGLKIGGGLSLIAAVVAEFAAGSAGAGSGLAFRLLEAQYRLNIPRLFAALVLLSATGVAIFALTSVVAWLSLRRWHESALAREN
ncbi:ABC transporter permease [Rhizobium sp. NFR03]|uniref:ABC transporter permease n=1 Tax=Rhizobium sp. NFR03 TaxID=1566263 RepID=UPI0008CED9F3|nr:ABC transporter permease [Rhizobium sp. NFR03]SES39671.1 NitT/TauT family transport system permease protein [Rhizobium sp. NFR03]